MVRVSSLAKLRPWSEFTAKNGDGGGSWVGESKLRKKGQKNGEERPPAKFTRKVVLAEKHVLLGFLLQTPFA